MHGYGKLVYEGNTYVGSFCKGKFEGKGQIVFQNEDIYNGQFKGGKFHGDGEFISKTDNFKGEFKDGKYHSQGMLEKLINSEKTIFYGNFVDGELSTTDQAQIKYGNGDLYLGFVQNFLPQGTGTLFK